MEPVKPIFWHQGLFLQPQHFQLLEQYHTTAQARLILSRHPYFWGVHRFEVQHSDLQNEVLVVRRGDLIFPDGTWTTFPGNARIFSRSFANTKYKEGRPLSVYAGLARWKESGANVANGEGNNPDTAPNTRFICDSDFQEVNDIYQSGPTAQVRLMCHAVRLFWGDEIEQASDYHLLPVVQLEHDGREVKLSESYIPPCVTLESSDVLMRTIKNLRELIAARCRHLDKFKRPIRIRRPEADQNYLVYVLIIQSLSQYLPLLYHLTETPFAHPWTIYGILRQLAGELSSFSDQVDALGRNPEGEEQIPPYDHKAMGHCFHEIRILIEDLLNAVTIVPENVVQLERRGATFSADLPVESFAPQYEYYLSINTKTFQGEEVDRETVAKTILLAKITSRKQVDDLIRRNLPGVTLDYRPNPPLGLPKRSDSCYFKVDSNHDLWSRHIVKDRSIAVYWEKAPDDAQADLYILKA